MPRATPGWRMSGSLDDDPLLDAVRAHDVEARQREHQPSAPREKILLAPGDLVAEMPRQHEQIVGAPRAPLFLRDDRHTAARRDPPEFPRRPPQARRQLARPPA